MGIDEDEIQIEIEIQMMKLEIEIQDEIQLNWKNLLLQWKFMKSRGGWGRQTNGKYHYT